MLWGVSPKQTRRARRAGRATNAIPVRLSALDRLGDSPSCTAVTTVPPSASATVVVIINSPCSAGSALSNSTTSTTCSFGTSITKRPWYVSVRARFTDAGGRLVGDYPGREGARVAIGQTNAGRYLRVIYVLDPVSDSVL